MCAKGKGPPPPQLHKFWLSQRWHLPARAGGLDDQDYRDVHTTEQLLVAYEAVKAWRSGKTTAEQAETIAWLTKIGVMARD